ncbi:MAG: FHA domain-containing protein [Phycisphaerae bacterium]
MPIAVRCPQCRVVAAVSRSAVGMDVQCKGCHHIFPVRAGAADLTIEWGAPLVGLRVPLAPPGSLTIGRADENDLVLPGPGVSRHHCRIAWAGDGWNVEDLGSGNGTFVDGQKVKTLRVENGATILVGDFALRVRVASGGGQASTLSGPPPAAGISVPPTADARASTVLGASGIDRAPLPAAAPRHAAEPHPAARRHRPLSHKQARGLHYFVIACGVILAGVVAALLFGRR